MAHRVRSQPCSNCGMRSHLFQSECLRDLHGDDVFKTSCAVCQEEIAPGVSRESGRFGNLFCTLECKAEGMEMLLDEALTPSEGGVAHA